jgi:hypothetical protein
LAGQLAHNLKSNAAVKQADELLQILERSPVAAAHAFATTPPAASVNLPGSSRDATTPQATARFAGSPDTPASDPVSDFDAVARQVARHLNADRDEAALELIQRALPSHPCRSRLYFGQALALARLGRAQDARRVLRQLPERERNAGKVRLLLEELEARA